MPNWEQWINDDGVAVGCNRGKSKKPNKNFYCRKNKLSGNRYGPHEYKEGGHICIKCGHLKDKPQKIETLKIETLKEREEQHEQRDE